MVAGAQRFAAHALAAEVAVLPEQRLLLLEEFQLPDGELGIGE